MPVYTQSSAQASLHQAISKRHFTQSPTYCSQRSPQQMLRTLFTRPVYVCNKRQSSKQFPGRPLSSTPSSRDLFASMVFLAVPLVQFVEARSRYLLFKLHLRKEMQRGAVQTNLPCVGACQKIPNQQCPLGCLSNMSPQPEGLVRSKSSNELRLCPQGCDRRGSSATTQIRDWTFCVS